MRGLGKPKLPESRKKVSDFLQQRLGGVTSVHAYYDADESHVVAVVDADGAPHATLQACATASLHAYPNELEGEDIRVELLMVGKSGIPEIAEIVSTSAFFVIKSHWLAAPGVVFPGMVLDHVPTTTTPNLMWQETFDFDDLATLEISGIEQEVHVLQGVPLSDPEVAYLREFGFDALTTLLEEEKVDHFDLFRASVV